MAESETRWDPEPHTRAKHDLLTNYLNRWFPILSSAYNRLLYVDGFAGPGGYSDGSEGSPLLALKIAREHLLLRPDVRPDLRLSFVFIEERQDRFTDLQRQVQAETLPSSWHARCIQGSFESGMVELLPLLRAQGASFVFIDPFGPTGFPMSLVAQIAEHPRAEVLINFSYQPLNQWFLRDSGKHRRLDALFGDARWRPALAIQDPRDREDFLVRQYREALEERGWHGLHFRMVNKHNQTQYYLLFGTKSYRGLLAMKEAMWSVSPDGEFAYYDGFDPVQSRLFSEAWDAVYSKELAETIHEIRAGQVVPLQDLVENELAFHPTCIERHLRPALRALEAQGRIAGVETGDGRRRRSRSFPEGCRITFAPKPFL